MYPAFRLTKEILRFRKSPTLRLGETHVTRLICWPGDIDVFMELNNGRTLTLYDFGRIVMFRRMGTFEAMKNNKWAGTVAGISIRYRARVRTFQRIEMHSKMVGWDARFVYITQSMWRGETCTSQALVRVAITDENGLVPTNRVAKAMELPEQSPPLPDWITSWAEAEGARPWPPNR